MLVYHTLHNNIKDSKLHGEINIIVPRLNFEHTSHIENNRTKADYETPFEKIIDTTNKIIAGSQEIDIFGMRRAGA